MPGPVSYPSAGHLLAMQRELTQTRADAAPSGAGIGATIGGAPSVSATEVAGPSFGERVAGMLERVEGLGERADAASAGLLRGEHDDVHGTMIAMQEADVAFRLAANVRNRAVEAYREIMRMGS